MNILLLIKADHQSVIIVIEHIWTFCCWWINDYQPVTQTCQMSVADEMPIISLLHKYVCTSVADEMRLSACYTNVSEHLLLMTMIISLLHKHAQTSVAADSLPCSSNLFVGMCIMFTIECTYLMWGRGSKIYLLYFTVHTQHHTVEMDKRPAQFGYRKAETQVKVLSQHSCMPHGNSKNTYDLERRYEENIPMANL